MEANIIVSGVPRIKDTMENTRRLNIAFEAFFQRYPEALIQEPTIESYGKSSQSIAFAVAANELWAAQEMHTYFETQLVEVGLGPATSKEAAEAATEDLLNKILDSDTDITYLKDSSGIGKGVSKDINKTSDLLKHKELVEKFGTGFSLAIKLVNNNIELPTEDQLVEIAENAEYM